MNTDFTSPTWYYAPYDAPGGSPAGGAAQPVGPLTWAQLLALAQTGQVGPGDLVWNPELPRGPLLCRSLAVRRARHSAGPSRPCHAALASPWAPRSRPVARRQALCGPRRHPHAVPVRPAPPPAPPGSCRY